MPKMTSAKRAPLMEFKDLGRKGENSRELYFNAFTEDLFTRDNDVNGGNEKILRIIQYSIYLAGLQEPEMENGIRPLFQRYAKCSFTVEEVPVCRR